MNIVPYLLTCTDIYMFILILLPVVLRVDLHKKLCWSFASHKAQQMRRAPTSAALLAGREALELSFVGGAAMFVQEKDASAAAGAARHWR